MPCASQKNTAMTFRCTFLIFGMTGGSPPGAQPPYLVACYKSPFELQPITFIFLKKTLPTNDELFYPRWIEALGPSEL